MEDLSPEAKQIYDLLKVSAREVVEVRVNAYRSTATQAMSQLIKDNDTKFADLNTKVDDAMFEIRRALDKLGPGASSSATPGATTRSPFEDAEGQLGHCGENQGRRPGYYVPPPARGTRDHHNSSSMDKSGEEIFLECPDHFIPGPRVDLPCFVGVQPRLWQSRCEEYFQLCGTPPSLWVSYASAQFDGDRKSVV